MRRAEAGEEAQSHGLPKPSLDTEREKSFRPVPFLDGPKQAHGPWDKNLHVLTASPPPRNSRRRRRRRSRRPIPDIKRFHRSDPAAVGVPASLPTRAVARDSQARSLLLIRLAAGYQVSRFAPARTAASRMPHAARPFSPLQSASVRTTTNSGVSCCSPGPPATRY
ncbi:unnamed protein product [Urochloa humidicola]